MKTTDKSLISGLSYALDIAENNYLSHAKHVTYTALHLGRIIEGVDLRSLYFASLIHDFGAGMTYGVKEHSLSGSEIIKNLPLDLYISIIVLYHHEEYSGNGPFGLKGSEIPIESQIIYAANLIDYHLKGKLRAEYTDKLTLIDLIRTLNDRLNPLIISALYSLVEKPYFLLEYFDTSIDMIVQQQSLDISSKVMDLDGIIQFAEAFSRLIDQRNHFTSKHSIGIANIVKRIAVVMEYSHIDKQQLYIAALLHDIGKLAVDNTIINKPGKLDPPERFEIETHTYYTRWILGKIDGFEEIANWASNHHEKLDGSGYPYGRSGEQLDIFSRIIAIADIYQALLEERPYRPPIIKRKIYSILREMGKSNTLDLELINLMIERKIL